MMMRSILLCSTMLGFMEAGTASAQTVPSGGGQAQSSTEVAPVQAPSQPAQQPTPSGSREPSSALQTPPADPQATASATAAPSGTTAEANGSEVVVTGSRTITNGYAAPTPITVVTAEQLRSTQPSIVEGLRDIPQLSASTSARTPTRITAAGNTTVGGANLRNLGVGRTLVLFDGRRGPLSGASGTVDISLFPDLLVKRVDVVTGGTSAAYGSDAVAGVVNFILDTDLKGLKLDASEGISDKGDGNTYTARAAGGFSFGGGRGHVVASVDIFHQDGIDGYSRDWSTAGWARIANPTAAQPQFLLRSGVTQSNASFGGLITGPTALRGTAFDPNGAPVPFKYGTLNNGNYMVGGDGAFFPFPVSAESSSQTGFMHAKYDVTDSINVFAEGLYGHSTSAFPLFLSTAFGPNQYTIFADNAFLPASIRAQMQAQNIASFTLGKVARAEGPVINRNENSTVSFVGGFNAKLGGGWLLDGYYEYGRNTLDYGNSNISIRTHLYAAADAVISPTTGQIVCRITLTNPSSGCVPINPFGEAPLTDAQRAYLKAEQNIHSLAQQHSAALTLRGSPLSTWAGPISIAVGAEYRRQSVNITTDPNAVMAIDGTGIRGFPAALQGQKLYYNTNNVPQPTSGAYSVKEGFGEISIPLAANTSWARSLDLNAAGRYTNYSTSGGVTTWKVGLTYAPVEALRFRATRSRDIRAPNISELFGVSTTNVSTLLDPTRNNVAQSNVRTISGANPGLTPERADTWTGGAVFRAHGFGLSIDYYSIKIRDAISSLTGQQILDQCAAGQTALCGNVQRDASGALSVVNANLLNIQSVEASGVDLEGSYVRSLGEGRLSLRGIGTYVAHNKLINIVGAPIEQAGAGSANPRWIASFTTNYSNNGFSLAVKERFISALNRVLPPATIDDNRIPPTFYTDVRIGYALPNVRGTPELYFSVNNLLDQDPRITDTSGGAAGLFQVTNASLYDAIGRFFTVGVQARF